MQGLYNCIPETDDHVCKVCIVAAVLCLQFVLHVMLFHTAKNTQLLKAGRMDNRRPKRASRNKKENIYLGKWNVLTMLQPGKMQEVAEQILQTELQIVALQEIRWKGQGQIKKDNITFTIAVKKAKQDSWEQDS